MAEARGNEDGLLERIEREAGVPGLAEVLAKRLAPTDLQSLMLEVYRRRAADVTPAALLERFAENRFVRPATADPRAMAAFDLRAFELLPKGYEPVEFSPVAPLGAHSAIATVDQNKVVTTSRNTEVVADTTNVQALESALRRRKDPSKEVKLAASHRLLRAQKFDAPGAFAHFRLLTLTAAGKDEGSSRFEMRHLHEQLDYLLCVVSRCGARPRVLVTDLADGRMTPLVKDDVFRKLAITWPDAELGFDPDRKGGRGFYETLCFKLHLGDFEVGDGGFNDWTAKLLGSKKERLLCGCLAGERVMQASQPRP